MIKCKKHSDSVVLEGEMEGARRATGISPSSAAAAPPASDPEVLEKPKRRRFTAQYKQQILDEAAQCTAPGEIGALLRREGLYSSHLTTWRRQHDSGALAGLTPHQRGRKANPRAAEARRLAELEQENERLRQQLQQAQTIIEVQKKLSSLLGIPMNHAKTNGSE